MNALRHGQHITTTEGVFLVTAAGLPNSCAVCGRPQAGLWLAEHEDAARSGQGRCPGCAGVGETSEVDREELAAALRELLERNKAPHFEGMTQLVEPAEAAVLAGEGIETCADLTIAAELVTEEAARPNQVVTNELVTEISQAALPAVTNEPEPTDGLTTINGISRARAAELARLGIATCADLAAANTAELATALGVRPATVKGWQTQARKLAGGD